MNGIRTRSRAGPRISSPRCSTATIFDADIAIDDVVARDTSRRLAQKKASSSASPPAPPWRCAARCAKSAPDGTVLLAMLPDTGERYLSTFLFEGVNEGSDDEWLATLG